MPAAGAGETICVGVLPPGVYDDVLVPEGASCSLSGSTVKGNVKALKGSELISRGNTVGGNILGDYTRNFSLQNDTIGGNIEVVGSNDVGICNETLSKGNIFVQKSNPNRLPGNGFVIVGRGTIGCPGNTVREGNVIVEESYIPPNGELEISANTISRGNLQVFKNKGPGPKDVSNNTGGGSAGGNLQCKENDAPFNGNGTNVNWKSKEEQCR